MILNFYCLIYQKIERFKYFDNLIKYNFIILNLINFYYRLTRIIIRLMILIIQFII